MGESDHIEFLVLRHGQSEADISVPRVFEGRLETRLTETGLEQARLAARWIAEEYRLDRIISSPLKRARATAEEVGRATKLTVEYDEGLLERDNGVLAGLTSAQAEAKGLLPLGKYRPHESVPGGESLIAFRARAEICWSRLLGQSTAGQSILIVSHGQMIGMLFRCFLRLPVDDSARLMTADTGIHCWRVDPKEPNILFCNSLMHLKLGKAIR